MLKAQSPQWGRNVPYDAKEVTLKGDRQVILEVRPLGHAIGVISAMERYAPYMEIAS